jgi:hypothetical protein
MYFWLPGARQHEDEIVQTYRRLPVFPREHEINAVIAGVVHKNGGSTQKLKFE